MKKLLPIFIAILLCTSCDKEEVIVGGCLEQILTDFDMMPYTGQYYSGCTFLVHQYMHQKELYYRLDNPCVDATFSIVDCEGNDICTDDAPQICEDFLSNATYQGIVGIAP